MKRLINYKGLCCSHRREKEKHEIPESVSALTPFLLFSALKIKALTFLCVSLVLLTTTSSAQNNIRQDILLNDNWLTSLNNTSEWKKINVPQNWDDYFGYRRLLHGNL